MDLNKYERAKIIDLRVRQLIMEGHVGNLVDKAYKELMQGKLNYKIRKT
jgi:DNA-directed RNA polymerase subunit K/omega